LFVPSFRATALLFLNGAGDPGRPGRQQSAELMRSRSGVSLEPHGEHIVWANDDPHNSQADQSGSNRLFERSVLAVKECRLDRESIEKARGFNDLASELSHNPLNRFRNCLRMRLVVKLDADPCGSLDVLS